MRVVKLSLLNFRNYEELSAELRPGNILILGRNGQGKTNLVEAIGYFNSLSSHRVSADLPLYKAGFGHMVARLTVANQNSAPTLELEFKAQRPKKAQINGNSVKTRELTRYFSSVLFAPEDLMIARGEPSARRSFMDSAVVTRNPYFITVLKEYERVIKQRSALLKEMRMQRYADSNSADITYWDNTFADLGTRIMAERRRLIDQLEPQLKITYAALVDADHSPELAIIESAGNVSRETYHVGALNLETGKGRFDHLSNVSRETLLSDFMARINQLKRAEIERGQTLMGPHRDDLELKLNSLPVKGYASHGESWSMVLGLKLALAGLLREEFAPEDPVLILDDVFAELDSSRRSKLMQAVADYEQVIVTAAVAEDIPKGESWQVYVIEKGKLLSSGETTDPAGFFSEVTNKEREVK